MKFKNKKGFTIIEVILALAVFAIIIIGIFYIYNKVTVEHKTKVLYQQILTIDNAINSIYTTDRSYPYLTNSFLINSGYLKNSLLHDDKANNDSLNSSFGGMIDVFSSSVSGLGFSKTSTDAYSISVYGVPSKSCVQLISSFYNYYDVITVNYGFSPNGSTLSYNDSDTIKTVYSTKPDINDIISKCQDKNNSVRIILTRR